MEDLIFEEDGNVRLERIIYELASKKHLPFAASLINNEVIKKRGIDNYSLVESVLKEMVNKGELNTFGPYYIPKNIKYTVTAE